MPSPRILLCPNAFKGTLSAVEAARAMRDGIRVAWPQAAIDLMPAADGGPGTLEAVAAKLKGKRRRVRVPGPLGKPLVAVWIKAGKLALIESALAIGLERVPKARRDAMKASSAGLGRLLLAAKAAGCVEAMVGLGGSATTDGGMGMARVLGWSFLDAKGRELGEGGGELSRLAALRAPKINPLRGLKIRVLCDVDHPLYGPRGAAFVFAPQKGATKSQVRLLDAGLRRLARFLRPGLASRPGAGAAGGLGAGMMAFCGARLVPGADTLLRMLDFEGRLRRADWVITGEGRLDAQSRGGKLPWRVARAARRAGKECLIVAGSVDGDWRDLASTLEIGEAGRNPAADLKAAMKAWAKSQCRA